MKSKNIIISQYEMASKIYIIREKKVMLDSDLAKLYKVSTKVLNQAVKRNIARFPKEFIFQLTENEYNSLRSQIVTLKSERGKHRKYLPYVFTEHGIAMLSSVLKSEKAIQINIMIIRTFIKLRKFILTNTELRLLIKKSEHRLNKYGEQIIKNKKSINTLEELIKQLLNPLEKPKKNWVYY